MKLDPSIITPLETPMRMRKKLGILLVLCSAFFGKNSLAAKNRSDQAAGEMNYSPAANQLTPNIGGFLKEVLARLEQKEWANLSGGGEGSKVHSLNETPYSYGYIIPYVSNQNNSRTNLGLNNIARNSLTKGANPTAQVLVGLSDQHGRAVGTKTYLVRANEMLQINSVIDALGGREMTGYLTIYSDVPLTAWASVILNSTNDPSIEMAIMPQDNKPKTALKGIGPRILIPSSISSGDFRSSLVVLNTGLHTLNVLVRIYDNAGVQIGSRYLTIESGGLFVDEDIRRALPGTYGQILAEITPEPSLDDDPFPKIIALSVVRSGNGTGAFFPGFALPRFASTAIAGFWQGTLKGGLFDAQVSVTIWQEEDSLYGYMQFLDGTSPYTFHKQPGVLSVIGDVIESQYELEIHDVLQDDGTFFAHRFFGGISGSRFEGKMLYCDESGRKENGTFSFQRMGNGY